MQIILKKLNQLTDYEKSAIYSLRYRNGMLWGEFQHCLKNNIEIARVIIARTRNKVLGWGLISKYLKNLVFMVYVHKDYRRRGIGSLILNKAKSFAKRRNLVLHVYNGSQGKTPSAKIRYLFYDKHISLKKLASE